MSHASDVIEERLAQLQAVVDAAEPGSMSIDDETIRLLELYLHWLPPDRQRRWRDKNLEALRRAVFG